MLLWAVQVPGGAFLSLDVTNARDGVGLNQKLIPICGATFRSFAISWASLNPAIKLTRETIIFPHF